MICDSKVSARKKGKINKTVVRPAKLYGMETVPLTFSKNNKEAELEGAELKTLQFPLGVTRMDKVRNDYDIGITHVRQVVEQSKRGEAEVVWTCQEERQGVCGEEDAGQGSTQQEEERETKEKIYGCCEGRHASGGRDTGRRRRPSALENSDSL